MKNILICLVALCIFCSCRSSRSMQRELNEMRAELYYELTSPEYIGEVKKTVYLDFIDYSGTDYYSSIRRKGGFFVPLLVFNYQKDRFQTQLGEHSLNYLYREFLTEALLTECNSSTCFRLIDNKKPQALPDSTYRLEVKVRENKTHAGVNLTETSFIWFDDFMEFPGAHLRPAQTTLSISVRLTQQQDCLLDKTYRIERKQPRRKRSYPDSYAANKACLDDMAESLSLATKNLVEEISQELHLILLQK